MNNYFYQASSKEEEVKREVHYHTHYNQYYIHNSGGTIHIHGAGNLVNEPTAGKKLREIMSKGAKINLKEFSKLDQSKFMKGITSR